MLKSEDYFGEAKKQKRRKRTSSSSFIPAGSQSARGIVDCIHTLLEQLLNVIDSSSVGTRSSPQMNEDDVDESETLKYRLRFVNEIPSTIYSNKQIVAENGEPLQIAICDATANSNHIINVLPLSSSQIQFFILHGEFAADQPDEESISWTSTDFNQSTLLPRDEKGPLIIGKDLKLSLKNGVGYLTSLIITDNSNWLRSRTFRLGAKVIDKKILAKFPRIGEAVSRPFRVKDQRSQANKKHHPPKWEDNVWRLEGVGKTGRIINILSSKGINTVGDFLTIFEKKGFPYLRQLLGEVPDRIWNMMYCNALEYYTAPSAMDPSLEDHLVEHEAKGAEHFSGNLKVENSTDDNDELSEDTPHQRFDSEFQAALESFNLSSQKKLAENEVMGINTNVGDGHGNLKTLEPPDHSSPSFSSSIEKFCMEIESMGGGALNGNLQDYDMISGDILRDNPPLLSTHGEPSTSYNHIDSASFHITSKRILMHNRAMGGKTLGMNPELIGEKENFDVHRGNLNTSNPVSTFSDFVCSPLQDFDLMLPAISVEKYLHTHHLDNLPSTSYSYNHEDLASLLLSFEENFDENYDVGYGNLNTSNDVSTFSNFVFCPLEDFNLMLPEISMENYLHAHQSDNPPSTSCRYSYNHEALTSFPLSYEENLIRENVDENSDVGHGNLNTSNPISTFSNFAFSPLQDYYLLLPEISTENYLRTHQSDNLPSTSYSYNHEDLTSFL